MAYRITGTTDNDKQLLDAIREHAWKQRRDVSDVMREAFLKLLYGTKAHWPEEYR